MVRRLRSITFNTAVINSVDLAYFAGMVDGDGSVRVSYYPRDVGHLNPCAYLNVYNQSRDLMLWLVEKFGGSFKWRGPRHNRSIKTGGGYTWQIGGATNVAWLLRRMIQYLVVKLSKAVHVLSCLGKYIRKSRGLA